MDKSAQISWEQIIELIPVKICLYINEEEDNLENLLPLVQDCIHKQSNEPLEEKFIEESNEMDHPLLENYIAQLKKSILMAFEISDEEVDQLMLKYENHICELLYQRGQSNQLKDLIENTAEQNMFYDTSYQMEPDSWRWRNKRVAKERKRIKKHLGIKQKDTFLDQALWDCIQNATYGGKLEIYFKDKLENYLEIDKRFNAIEFKNFSIGIINHENGSGYQADTSGYAISLPLNTENIFIEKNVSYNWTYQIAGMGEDAYNNAEVCFKHLDSNNHISSSLINDHIEKEAELDRVFKEGGCTFLDMKYTRHRDQYYENSFPCGTHCPHCKTFWID